MQEPLRKIRTFGDRLKVRNAQLDEHNRDYLDRMLDASARMQTLINDLLAFSRVMRNKAEPQPVNLGVIAREVARDLDAQIEASGGRIEIGDLAVIEAEPMQMRQLLQNLIGNALKFHRPDVPPIVTVSGEAVTERGGLTGPHYCIYVADNGIGFNEKYLDRIFTVFQRLHSRYEYEGTGVGLAICDKIAKYHGGTITARSTPGAGATFIVTLPTMSKGRAGGFHERTGPTDHYFDCR